MKEPKDAGPFDLDAAANERFRSFLKERGLLDAASALNYRYLSRDATSGYLGYDAGSDAIAIGYSGLDGAPVSERVERPGAGPKMETFQRLRLLGVEARGKYRQLKGTGAHARLTPNALVSWVKVAESADVPLIITEGEFKADLANITRAGDGTAAWLPVVGLGGVSSWMGKKGSGALMVGELAAFAWKGRRVYLAFDWDAGVSREARYKAEVKDAIDRLAAALMGLGADVWVAHLADTEVAKKKESEEKEGGGARSKLALDDFILAGGTCAQLLDCAEPSSAKNALAELLARYAWVVVEERVLDIETGRVMSLAGFTMDNAGKTVEGAGGKKIRAVELWKMSPHRMNVATRGFWPDKGRGLARIKVEGLREEEELRKHTFVGDSEGMVLVYNDFLPPEGWEWEWMGRLEEKERIAAEAAVALWGELVEGVVGSSEEKEEDSARMVRLFHDWVANIVKEGRVGVSGMRNRTCWIILSPEQGIGKSLLCETVARMMGAQGTIVGPDVLGSTWSMFLYRQLVVTASEMEETSSGGMVEAMVKNIISADAMMFNEKNVPRFAAKNFASILISTNRPLAFKVTKDGRREIMVRPGKMAADGKWKAKLEEFARSFVVGDERGRRLAHGAVLWWYRWAYAMNEGWTPYAEAPRTDAKDRAAEYGRSHAEEAADEAAKWIEEIAREQGGRFATRASVLRGAIVRMLSNGEFDPKISTQTVVKHLDAQHGARVVAMRLDGKPTKIRLWGLSQSEFIDQMGPAERQILMDKTEKKLME